MEEDVTRAIKQLETIAIKAMNNGYLDDAAKVMHIAEEIERVDKTGASEKELETESSTEPAMVQSQQPEDLKSTEQQSFDRPAGNVVPLNRFKLKLSPAVGDDMPESPLQ